jgi:hypothetical protein
MKLARALAFGTALACAALMAVAPTALAQSNPRTYTAAISPGWIATGQTKTFDLALTNTSSIRSGIESANISPPPGFVLQRAFPMPEGARGSASVVGNVLQLRGISVPSRSTLHVFVRATAPSSCTDTSGVWRPVARQHDNFTGDTFALSGDGSSLTTTLACALVFTTQPTDSVINQTISGTAFDPMGPPVAVEVVDRSGNPVTSSTAPITVALGSNPGGSTLGGTTTQKADGGVASFRDLTLNNAGGPYTLVASSPGLTSATSNPFNEAAQFTQTSCPQGQSCSTTLSTNVSSLQVTANPTANPDNSNSGTLDEAVDLGSALQCTGYEPFDPNWYTFVSSSINRIKVITYTFFGSPEGIQVCFGAPYEFTTSSGQPAPHVMLPDGTTEFEGLLPSCAVRNNPCVQSTTTQGGTNGVNTVVTVRIPDGLPGDPRMRM